MSEEIKDDTVADASSELHSDRGLQGPAVRFDLETEASRLRGDKTFAEHGHAAKTLLKHADLRVVLLVFKSGGKLKTHQTDHGITVQMVSGRVRMHLSQETIELGAGQLAALERSVPHDVEALEDSVTLLSIGWGRTG